MTEVRHKPAADRAADVTATPLGLVLLACLLWLEGGGIWHAFEGHGIAQGICAVCVPPYAMFMSVEFFFH